MADKIYEKNSEEYKKAKSFLERGYGLDRYFIPEDAWEAMIQRLAPDFLLHKGVKNG